MQEESKTKIDYSPKRIAWLAGRLASNLEHSIGEIQAINEQTKIISINAKITSAKAGEAGKSFAVVANEVMSLSHRTATVAKALEEESRTSIEELINISSMLDTRVRGERHSIYARTNIDLIDRNLYERSCDVRWWATDNSLVEALELPSSERYRFASERMRVILSAYTVYYDLILADTNGMVVANGRPDLYHSQGSEVKGQSWFQEAIDSVTGDEFGFQSVHKTSLVNNQRVLVYSCAVRKGGKSHGEILGVLGIVFNWDSLAQTVVKNTPIDSEEWKSARVCILDRSGQILADSNDRQLMESLSFGEAQTIFSGNRGFLQTSVNNNRSFVAYAPSEGFETYRSGWFSVVMQTIE